MGKATAEFDTKKGGYRIAATGDSECAEPIVVCDITKPFTNTLCGGTVTWTLTLIGVALLVLAASYFAPLPPRAEAPPEQARG